MIRETHIGRDRTDDGGICFRINELHTTIETTNCQIIIVNPEYPVRIAIDMMSFTSLRDPFFLFPPFFTRAGARVPSYGLADLLNLLPPDARPRVRVGGDFRFL